MTRWTDAHLTAMRQVGDPEVDELVEKVLPRHGTESIGRLGYNYMLDLADQLLAAPALTLIDGSQLSTQLRGLPADLVNYFDPLEAPDWVDADKLKVATQLWDDNTILCLTMLYSASLPACYLTARGIPALYQSEKLKDAKYIFQRIYETGTFLEAVLDKGGLQVLEDIDSDDEQLMVKALNSLDADGHWKYSGRRYQRTGQTEGKPLDPKAVQETVEKFRGAPKRYLWGRGYITTRKVRFLHASMRFMLTQPDKVRAVGSKEQPATLAESMSQRQKPYNSAELGVPVNQEDLAYTLMTFSIAIPKGIEGLGVPLTLEQKEAFLHLWKVVGYILGIRQDLMTDNWAEAEELYALIQKRQALASEEGTVLTEALMNFLGEYLPHIPGIADRLSAHMIIGQIGLDQARKILRPQLVTATTRLPRRVFYWALGQLAWFYFILRKRVTRLFPTFAGLTASRLHEASEQLIASWRGAFDRKPFYVPADATTWVQQPGVNDAYLETLQAWRRRLFNTIGASVGFLFFAVVSLASALPIWYFSEPTSLRASIGISLGLSLGFWLLSLATMQWALPAVFRDRPRIGSN